MKVVLPNFFPQESGLSGSGPWGVIGMIAAWGVIGMIAVKLK